MRRFYFTAVLSMLFVNRLEAQCTTQCSPSCNAPSCTTPPNPNPESTPFNEAFAAPPRNGTAVGASRSLGIEGFGLHIPAMSLRLPTLQLPGLVCYRREPRMLIDAAEAPLTSQINRETTVPSPESTPAPVPESTPINSCISGSAAAAPVRINGTQLVPIDPAVIGVQPPAPPTPKAIRTIAHPDVGAANPMNGQYMQDPTTGQIYQVVVQPAQVQLQPVAMPVQMPVQYQQVQYQTVAASAASYPTTPAPLPAVVPTAMHEPITSAAPAHTFSQREAALMADLQATQQQAAQLEGELRRLESMVDRLAQAQPTVAPAPAVQPSNVPFQSVSGSVPLNGRDQESSGGAATSLMRLFKQK